MTITGYLECRSNQICPDNADYIAHQRERDPASPYVQALGTAQFKATAANDGANAGVTWSTSCASAGNCGSISADWPVYRACDESDRRRDDPCIVKDRSLAVGTCISHHHKYSTDHRFFCARSAIHYCGRSDPVHYRDGRERPRRIWAELDRDLRFSRSLRNHQWSNHACADWR